MDRPSRPEDMVGEALPPIELPDFDGNPYPLRRNVGHGASVLFFIIRSGTPG